MSENKTPEPIAWQDGALRILDQTRLPQKIAYLETRDYRDVIVAIQRLQVRGAPLIGIAGAYALALAAQIATTPEALRAAGDEIAAARPTAVNLAWAIRRCLAATEATPDAAGALLAEAQAIHQEEQQANLRMGRLGADLLPAKATILTHCNTGALATGGSGTALGVILAAREAGRLRQVYATETRPLLQGARLTAWELQNAGIPCRLIVDSAAGQLLHRGGVDAVVVGADRIAASGDVANKIGTYTLAVLARENGVPFYVAAPTSTVDLSLASGDLIPIEERAAQEVMSFGGQATAPEGTEAENPAFDVTPAAYVSAFITENGIARAPYADSLAAVCGAGVAARG
ncbi:MAG TPA: S-methyl-5-thioribose-1-phosphate isomerase [Dehalococcoidia bacterium]|nr:S-methyl-5-thioribose-1-phosphate isomerase [Dehalococcoidia bacterium]